MHWEDAEGEEIMIWMYYMKKPIFNKERKKDLFTLLPTRVFIL